MRNKSASKNRWQCRVKYDVHLIMNRDDIERAVQKLKVLGEGFKILHIGAKRMLQTVPGELNNDQTSIILMAQVMTRALGSTYHS